MIFIDTGYLVAIMRPADELHARAVAWSKAIRDRLVITEHVLWEAMNQLSSPAERRAAHQMLAEVLADRSCEVIYSSASLFDAGIQLHQRRPDKAWSLTDCISFHVMQERGIVQALAYDQHYQQAGFEPLLRRQP